MQKHYVGLTFVPAKDPATLDKPTRKENKDLYRQVDRLKSDGNFAGWFIVSIDTTGHGGQDKYWFPASKDDLDRYENNEITLDTFKELSYFVDAAGNEVHSP